MEFFFFFVSYAFEINFKCTLDYVSPQFCALTITVSALTLCAFLYLLVIFFFPITLPLFLLNTLCSVTLFDKTILEQIGYLSFYIKSEQLKENVLIWIHLKFLHENVDEIGNGESLYYVFNKTITGSFIFDSINDKNTFSNFSSNQDK